MNEEIDFAELAQFLIRYFNLDELRGLALSLNVQLENLSGNNLPAKVEELIGYMYRRGRLPELIAAAATERPNVNWPVISGEVAEIPFVIVAMNQTEAEELWQGIQLSPTFGQLQQTLQADGYADLVNRYGRDREAWQPFGSPHGSIQDVIESIIEFLNQDKFSSRRLPLLKAVFHSSSFFATPMVTRMNTWRELHRTGCVIVVDPISLFHPEMARALLQSQLGAKSEVAMLVISPIDPDSSPANALIEAQLNQQFAIPYVRFDQELDHLCEFGIGNLRALRRRLVATLPETAALLGNQRANRSSRDMLRQHMGNPRHFEQLIFRG